MRLAIEKVVYPGRRLAVHEGRTVFTDEGLPGELVEAALTGDRTSYLEATTERILTPSPDRVPPRCGHYMSCSPYQTMSPELQARIKAEQLREILARIGDLEATDPAYVSAPDPWHYRNKVRFQIAWSPRGASLAYHASGSETDLVPLTECHLVAAPVQALLTAVSEVAGTKGIRGLEGVEAKFSRASGELLLNLFWSAAPTPADVDPILFEILPRFPIAGVVSVRSKKRQKTATLEWGKDSIVERARDCEFEIGPTSFFQVHLAMLELVLGEIGNVPDAAGGGRVIDLYSGIGTFGLALARRAAVVETVESEPNNVSFLKKNIARNHLKNVRIHEGRSEELGVWLLEKPADVVVCDPPRKGLDPTIVRGFLAGRPSRVVYLSCNPTTLARDLKALGPIYDVERIMAFDFFPQTPHIETLAVLRLK